MIVNVRPWPFSACFNQNDKPSLQHQLNQQAFVLRDLVEAQTLMAVAESRPVRNSRWPMTIMTHDLLRVISKHELMVWLLVPWDFPEDRGLPL